jgi:hypothetical protein
LPLPQHLVPNLFHGFEALPAARGLVDMDQRMLADGAMVTPGVIIDFEKERRVPTRNNLAAIQRVLEEAGVEFTNGDAPGVRLRRKKL